MPTHEKLDYVEYPARDLGATKSFFRAAFGWSFEDYGPAYAAFSGQGLDGGFFQSDQAASVDAGSALLVFYSARLEETLAHVEAAGGRIVKPIFSFPGGRRFHFTEPSGNEMAVWSGPESEQTGGVESRPVESGHAPVNGLRMYYEAHGREEGVPLVLLHGGGSTIEVTFSRVLPVFAKSRRVIAVEEQGHGRTSGRDGPVRFETSADDVAALLRFLKVEKVDVFGFSNGASVALQVAIRHPELVRKLVFASSMTRRDGAHPQLWDFIAQADFSNMPQALKDAFLRVNPDEAQLRAMHDKDAERMQKFEDVPDELVRSVRAPTLVVTGDRDIVKPEHALELTRLLPGARLLMLPGGHGDYLGEVVATPKGTRSPELTACLIEEFLDAP